MERFILEFAGWCEIDPSTVMEYVGKGISPDITVKEWSKLSEEDKGNYIPGDAEKAIAKSVELEWDQLDIQEED